MGIEKNSSSIVFVTNGPIEDGPSRLRAYQYGRLWKSAGFGVDFINYGPRWRGSLDPKGVTLQLERADVVVIQRNLNWEILRQVMSFNKPLIFDYDDAMFFVRSSQILDTLQPHSIRQVLLPYYRKIFRGDSIYSGKRRILTKVLTYAAAVTAGNEYLATYTRQFNKNVHVVPTGVDLSTRPEKVHSAASPVVVGWVGLAHNFVHLDQVRSALSEVSRRHNQKVVLKVVSSEPYESPGIDVINERWRLEKESDSVASFDIGIMPLIDDQFAQGKCSFKAILCMSHGIPVVASDVGMNRTAINHGETGFLAKSEAEWVNYLSILVADVTSRKTMGKAAREDMENRYSVQVLFPRLLDVVNSLIRK